MDADNVLICHINPFLFAQVVTLGGRTVANLTIADFGRDMLDVCEINGVFNVHLFGNEEYITYITDQIEAAQFVKYQNTERINIEVN